MKTYDFEVGGQLVQLRLTTGKLNQYLVDTHADSQAPILGVLDAMTNLGKRIRLMTAALGWPGNENPYKKGDQLLDDMADDEDAPDMEDVILGLAADAGLVEVDQVEALIEAAKKGSRELMSNIRTLLAGEPLPDGADSAQAQAQPNPTKTAAD